MARLILFAVLLALFAGVPAPASMAQEAREDRFDQSKTVSHRLLFYLPNRVADALDTVRARVRIGPGLAVSARATKIASIFFGAYTSAYIGLPGPRGRAEFPKIAGEDSMSGAQLIVVQSTSEGKQAPGYAPDEVGAGVQLGIVGADAGVAPIEVLDLVAGFLFIDLRNDDY